MAEENSILEKQLAELLKNSKIDEALELSEDPRFEQIFTLNCWNLIEIISLHLNQETWDKDEKLVNCCESLINKVAERSPPEETLLEIISQIESLDDVRFSLLLIPMQKVLLRIKSKLAMSAEWCFNAIYRHLHSLPLPEIEDLEGEQRKLYDSDPCVKRISHLYSIVLPFYDPFISLLKDKDPEGEIKNKTQLKDSLLYSLFRLLSKPLLFMDLEHKDGPKSSLRLSSEKIIYNIAQIQPYIYMPILYRDLSNIKQDLLDGKKEYSNTKVMDIFLNEDKFSPISLAVYCYLIFKENLESEKLAHVYSQLFVLKSNLYLSTTLLYIPNSIVQRKGLLLIGSTLNRFADRTVPDEELVYPFYNDLIEGIFSVTLFSNTVENRLLALSQIKDLLFKFDTAGRYKLLTKMIKLAKHSGLAGYLAVIYKDFLNDVFKTPENETEFLTEQKILALLDSFCDLPEQGQTDLMESYDKIVASLNLIRFIVLRDKTNRTGIKNHIDDLEKHFLTPLRDAINLSRAHYKVKLKDVEEEKLNNKNKKLCEIPIFIGNSRVPNLPYDEKISVLKSALTSFDVIESLLCRVNECINLM